MSTCFGPIVNITYRQAILMTVGLTILCDEVAKTSNSEMKQEILELSKIVQSYAENFLNEPA